MTDTATHEPAEATTAESLLTELWLEGFSDHALARAAGVPQATLRAWRARWNVPREGRERLEVLAETARRVNEATGSDAAAAWIEARFTGSNRDGVDVIVAGRHDLLVEWVAGRLTIEEMLDRIFAEWRYDDPFEVFTASDGHRSIRPRRSACPAVPDTTQDRMITAVEQAADTGASLDTDQLVTIAGRAGTAVSPAELMVIGGAARARADALRARAAALDGAAQTLTDAAANGVTVKPTAS